MAAITYGKFSELILNAYYKFIRSDNANYTMRQIAEMVAHEVAFFAKGDAFEQSALGETTFANDQFISVYRAIALSTDADGNKYITMPQTPVGLPQGREIARVSFTGNKTVQVYPIRNKDVAFQSTRPKWMITYYVEDGKLVFGNLSNLVNATVDLRLVGAIPAGTELIDCVLNVPKNIESQIFDKILVRLNAVRGVKVDMINDGVSQ